MTTGRTIANYIQAKQENLAVQLLTPEHLATELEDHQTLLHLAVKHNLLKVVERLINLGADPFALDSDNQSPYSIALNNYQSQIMMALLASKAPITDNIGYAILKAIRQDRIEETRQLLTKAGKELSKEILTDFRIGPKEKTALQWAVKMNDTAMVELLLQYGAYPQQKNKADKDAKHYALKKNPKILDLINKSIESKQVESNEFTGRYKEEYERFVKYIQQQKFNYKDSTVLGNVALNNPKLYFEMDKTSQEYGLKFLNAFFSNDENRQGVIEIYNEKQNFNTLSEEKSPAVISFINFTLEDKNYCFVSPSAWGKHKELNMAETLDALKSEECTYIMNDDKVVNLHKISALLSQVGEVPLIRKNCAEKPCLKFLMKLFLEFGDKVKIHGISNYLFYPFNDKEPIPYNVPREKRIKINDKFYTASRDCCMNCQTYKYDFLNILMAAHKIGSEKKTRGYKSPNETFNPSPEQVRKSKRGDHKLDTVRLFHEKHKEPINPKTHTSFKPLPRRRTSEKKF